MRGFSKTMGVLVCLAGLTMSTSATAGVCPATNVVGTMQWVLASTRAAIQSDGQDCLATIKLKSAVPSPGIPSTVHFMRNGNVVKSVRVDIAGTTGEPVVLDTTKASRFDSVVVMANYN
jgi:hypothetical protein